MKSKVYYYILAECNDYVGLTSGVVLDVMMSASSSLSEFAGPGRGRVDQTKSKTVIKLCQMYIPHLP